MIPLLLPALGFLTGGNATRLAATVLAGAAIGGIGAWNVQSWRFGNEIAKFDRAVASSQIRALERGIENQNLKDKANENRIQNITANVAAADRARIAADSLRSASERSLQASRDNHSACIVSAATHAQLFDYCQREYREVAKAADGHATDAKALIESWPK